MKNLNYFVDRGLRNQEEVFNYLIETLKNSIFTWDYFVDFNKVNKNIKNIELELESLNSLLGLNELDIDDAFKKLVVLNPRVRKALPILIASRISKISTTPIIKDISSMVAENKKDLFNSKIPATEEIIDDLLLFFNKSGLRQFFVDNEVTNLVDFCKGIEVGMDTNARKNRTGTSMENILEDFLKDFCKAYNFQYIVQATKNKIRNEWDINLEVDKIERRFDFALLSPDRQLAVIEVNYYSGGGSKLKATAGEYKSLQQFLSAQEIDFIWVTDGEGWKTAKTALFETFEANDYTINLEMISNGILREILVDK